MRDIHLFHHRQSSTRTTFCKLHLLVSSLDLSICKTRPLFCVCVPPVFTSASSDYSFPFGIVEQLLSYQTWLPLTRLLSFSFTPKYLTQQPIIDSELISLEASSCRAKLSEGRQLYQSCCPTRSRTSCLARIPLDKLASQRSQFQGILRKLEGISRKVSSSGKGMQHLHCPRYNCRAAHRCRTRQHWRHN